MSALNNRVLEELEEAAESVLSTRREVVDLDRWAGTQTNTN